MTWKTNAIIPEQVTLINILQYGTIYYILMCAGLTFYYDIKTKVLKTEYYTALYKNI